MFYVRDNWSSKSGAVMFRNHYASAIGCKDSLGFDHDTIWLSVLPIYHISGLSVLLRAVIEGFTVRIDNLMPNKF